MKAAKLGDRHWLRLGDDGEVECVVRYLNAGMAWLFPIVEVESDAGRKTIPCCAIARIDRDGKVSRI